VASDVREVLIAGAGIGGLTLACALRRQGLRARVLESAPLLGPVGAGITVQSNAMSALKRVGLDGAVAAAGAEMTRAVILTPEGKLLCETPLEPLTRELGAPSIALLRSRLHRVLLQAVGEDAVETGRAVTGYQQEGRKVCAQVKTGDPVEADLLVGADGFRSVVRAQMAGDDEPDYAGYTSWRGVSPRADLVSPGRTCESWGRGERFGIVPIGFGEVYWFAVAQAPSGGRDAEPRAALLRRFGGWHAPIRELIASTDEARIVRTDIADRPPLSCWHDGRVALLGDAAHPMTPNMGQGGCQAIEDAVVLAACLGAAPSLESALRQYERRRMARAYGVVRASRRLGAIIQGTNPLLCWLRDTGMRLTPPSAMLRKLRDTLTFPE